MYSQGHYIYSSEYGYNKDNIIVGCMSKEAAAQTASVKNELNNISGVKGVSISYFALNSSDRYMNWERVNPEKPDVPLNKNDAFQKVQKRRVQEKR